jgi:ABC-type transport system involved in cytochrome c biogenesis permease component
MRWLLLKDLRILRRSPMLVALLVLYPIVLSVLIGFALSRGPERPRVAVLNQVPESAYEINLGGEDVDASRYAQRLFEHVEQVRVRDRAEAIRKVRDGEVLGALVIPPDITQKIEGGLEPARVDVFYNADDPVKARYVQDTIASQVQAANLALTRKLTEVSAGYLNLLVQGGTLPFFGQTVQIFGLADAQRVLRAARRDLPRSSPLRDEIAEVIESAQFVLDNLNLSEGLLATVGEPIRVDAQVVKGGSTPLTAFAVALSVTVSLMVITLLLAAGTLALEREENAFRRLVRGLVSRTSLLAEKVVLAALCSFLVALAMLVGLGLFVDLDWGRLPLWLAALAGGAVGFAAMGIAVGALTREVRAASLLAFMIALPIAFLALVPSGSVSEGLYDASRAVSAIFPFRPTLDALDAALNGGALAGPLLHLAAVTLVFAAAGRLALRRFA